LPESCFAVFIGIRIAVHEPADPHRAIGQGQRYLSQTVNGVNLIVDFEVKVLNTHRPHHALLRQGAAGEQ